MSLEKDSKSPLYPKSEVLMLRKVNNMELELEDFEGQESIGQRVGKEKALRGYSWLSPRWFPGNP